MASYLAVTGFYKEAPLNQLYPAHITLKEREETMKAIWIILLVAAFGIGFCLGAASERKDYLFSAGRESMVYEGAVYVWVVEGTTLEDYLTAAGKK